MSNPLFSQFGNSDFVSQFMNEFKKLQQSITNPQREVENLLRTGKMTQEEFNQFAQIANQIMPK